MTKYSNLSEDEALALALQQSVNNSSVSYESSVEDQLLKAVMEESMKLGPKNNDEYLNIDDEEIMINEAIRASYQSYK
jgi:hypothetical protein